MSQIKTFFTNYFSKIEWDQVISSWFGNIIQIVITVLILSIVRRLLTRSVDFYYDKAERFEKNPARQQTLRTLVQNFIQYTYYFLVIYSVLAILGVPVATLMAGAGIASVAIGIGAQGLVNDIVNGFFILLEHQFDVGDTVLINDYEGEISKLGIRTTVIKDFNGDLHFISNRNITDVTNRSRYPIRCDIDLRIYPDSDADQIEAVLRACMEKEQPDPLLAQDPIYLGVFRDSNRFNLIYRVRLFAVNGMQLDVEGKYYSKLTEALDQAGISQPESQFNTSMAMLQAREEKFNENA